MESTHQPFTLEQEQRIREIAREEIEGYHERERARWRAWHEADEASKRELEKKYPHRDIGLS